MIRNWKPEKLKQAIIAELVENGRIVGKFVEEDARARLTRINDPEWGEGYRTQIVGRLLTNEVEIIQNGVEIRVGVRTQGGNRHHGFYIETGSSTARAHPFLRPAVLQNAQRIVATLGGR
jgi:hypothetical protein